MKFYYYDMKLYCEDSLLDPNTFETSLQDTSKFLPLYQLGSKHDLGKRSKEEVSETYPFVLKGFFTVLK